MHNKKKELLKITDAKQLTKFMEKNNIPIEIKDEEIQRHLEKYIIFQDYPNDGIIRDLRDK